MSQPPFSTSFALPALRWAGKSARLSCTQDPSNRAGTQKEQMAACLRNEKRRVIDLLQNLEIFRFDLGGLDLEGHTLHLHQGDDRIARVFMKRNARDARMRVATWWVSVRWSTDFTHFPRSSQCSSPSQCGLVPIASICNPFCRVLSMTNRPTTPPVITAIITFFMNEQEPLRATTILPFMSFLFFRGSHSSGGVSHDGHPR